MEPKENYTLKGLKDIDGVFHIPLLEIVTLCRLFPSITGEQLQSLIVAAYKNLKQNEDLKKKIPVLHTKKKSILQRWIKKRSAPDASSQTTKE